MDPNRPVTAGAEALVEEGPAESTSRDWRVGASDLGPEALDPLLGCLMVLSRRHGNPRSAAELTAGLPLENGLLTPSQLPEAAARAGLHARLAARGLRDIPEASYPVILLLKDRLACVLSSRLEDGRVEIIRPETGGGTEIVDMDDLHQIHGGYVIYARPMESAREKRAVRPPAAMASWPWGTVKRFWGSYLHVMIASLVINLLALALPMFLLHGADTVIPMGARTTLNLMAIGLGLAILFDLLLRLVRGYLLEDAARRTEVLSGADLFAHVMSIRPGALPPAIGALAHRLSDFNPMRRLLGSGGLLLFLDLPFILLFLLVLSRLGHGLVAAPIIAGGLLVAVLLAIQVALGRAMDALQHLEAERHDLVSESLSALETIKSLGAESELQIRWERLTGAIAKRAQRARRLTSLAALAGLLSVHLMVLAVLVTGMKAVMADGFGIGEMLAGALFAMLALAPVARLATGLGEISLARAALRRIDGILDLPPERFPGKTLASRPLIRGGIEFRDARFAYSGTKMPVLSGVSFRIQPGERVGIIGPVGSGKSTLARLMAGLYRPDGGLVAMDGTDLDQMAPADIRRHVGILMQDVVLLNGTLRDNLTMGMPHADEAMIRRASRLAGLEPFVERHPLGYDLQVGEGGRALSTGQRQCAGLARALLCDPRLLILDEPTSGMDLQAEREFVNRLEPYLGNRTLIMISHRPSLFSLVDRLIVLGNGRVAADGARDQILKLGKSEREKAPPLRPKTSPLTGRQRAAAQKTPTPSTDETPDG